MSKVERPGDAWFRSGSARLPASSAGVHRARRGAPLVAILLATLLPMGLLGQERQRITFRNLTVDDGLSQADITALTQDSLGFLWVGTEDGLDRYDGHSVRAFKPLAFDTTSLSHPWVMGLAPAGGADLWVATEGGGLNRYDARRERFAHVAFPAWARIGKDLYVLLKARNGSLWIGTRYDGLFHYDPASARVEVFRSVRGDSAGLQDDRVASLLEDRQGRIWIGTEIGGLSRFDPHTGSWKRYAAQRGSEALPSASIRALLEDREGRVWIGTSGGLSRYRPETDDFVSWRHDPADTRSLGSDDVLSLLADPIGRLWIGTDRGLDRLDVRSGTIEHFRHDPADPTSLLAGPVQSLYLDRSGVFWVGTGTGLSAFEWNAPPFLHLASDPRDRNSLDDPDDWAIYEDRAGIVWVGSGSGLNRVDRKAGRITRYAEDPSDPSALQGGGVMGLYEDRAGDFWVGTRNGALQRFDRSTGRVVERLAMDPNDSTSLGTDNPWHMLEDREGRFWITSGGRGCLSRMERATRTFHRYCHAPGDPSSPAYDIAHDLIESPSGAFWLATWGGGLDRFDPASGTFEHHRHDPTNPNSPASDFIIALHRDAAGTLWLGLYGAGLDRFDPRSGTFTHYTTANSALPNDIVLAIEEDRGGDLWISTYRGLCRLTPGTGRFRNYGVQDGLQDLEFNSNASFHATSGELFFGGINGVSAFFPGRITDNPVAPPVVLTAMRIRGTPVSVDARGPLRSTLPFAREIRLAYDQHDMEISFAALHYTDPAGNHYRYRLEGYDAGWKEAGPEPTATYTNLDPGRYTFRVQAANSDGVWNREGATLAITIAPPWWRTWWAYTLYGLIAFALLYALRRYELNRLQLKSRLAMEFSVAEQLREVDRARSRFFANVSHEFRTPLTLTLGPLDDLLAGVHGPLSDTVIEQARLARRNAARVLDLINQILELTRLEAGRTPLRARRLDLAAFVDWTAAAFRPLAERRALALHVHVPAAPLPVYADPEQLQKVLSNLLSNALKFTPEGGTVTVGVEADERGARISVRDSGPGIPASEVARIFDRFHRVEGPVHGQAGTGIGLSLAKELAELHRGTLTVQSEEGLGSTFTVTLRRGVSHLSSDQIVAGDDTVPWRPDAGTPAPSVMAAEGVEVVDDAIEPIDSDVTTVLVVEDNAEVRGYLRKHLASEYRVLEEEDGEQGLARTRRDLPDLVISDVMMPKMDGHALCRALKRSPDTDFIPVILLTARAAPEDRLTGLQEEADDYLTKPFDVKELLARVANLIASRRKLKERFRGLPPTTLHASAIDVPSVDARFLETVRHSIENNLGDESFTVDRLARDVAHSRGHLHRRLRALIDESPSDLIRRIRLERAAQMLEARAGSVAAVAAAVGFKSVAHFSNRFHDQYGVRPSAYRAEQAPQRP